jgi:hypothetical protein
MEGIPMARKVAFLALALISIAALTGCSSTPPEAAQADLNRNMDGDLHRAHDGKHISEVDLTRVLRGDGDASALAQCYKDGYDNDLDYKPDGTPVWSSRPGLGPKYVARCERIDKAVIAHSKADEARHQKEISQ